MELLRIWEILIRRRWSISIIIFVFFIAVVAVTHLVPPTYESTAIVLNSDSQGATALMGALGLETTKMVVDGATFDADTEIALGLIKPILHTAIEQMELVDRRDNILKAEDLIERSMMNRFSPQPFVEMKQIETSSMVEIVAFSRDPNQASKLANLLADLYITKRAELEQQDFETALTFVDGNIDDLQQDYYATLHVYREFMKSTGAIDLDEETQNLLVHINSLNTLREGNLTEQEALTEELARIDSHLSRIVLEHGSEAKHPDTEQISQLKGTLYALLQQAAALKIDNTKASSDYRKLIATMDSVQDSISQEVGAMLSSQGETLSVFEQLTERKVNLTISLAVNEAKKKIIDQTLLEYQASLKTIAEKIVEGRKLNVELSVREGLYKKLLSIQKQLSLARQGMTSAGNILVQPATPSEDPEFPIAILNYIMGIILGGFWAFGYAFLVEYVDDTIQSPKDLDELWALPFLGLLPEFSQRGQKKNNPWKPEGSFGLERLRAIRNRLLEARRGKLPKSLLVTSTSDGEGKSHLVSSLGVTFAQYGLRVIAVDMDLRKPSLGNYFGESNHLGLSDYLSGAVPLEESIVSTSFPLLDFLPAGRVSTDPASFLYDRQLTSVIEELQRSYDMVLIDTPAIRDHEDAISISRIVEAIVFVVAAGRTSAPKAKDVIERLQLADYMIAGVVMNRTDPLQYRRLR